MEVDADTDAGALPPKLNPPPPLVFALLFGAPNPKPPEAVEPKPPKVLADDPPRPKPDETEAEAEAEADVLE